MFILMLFLKFIIKVIKIICLLFYKFKLNRLRKNFSRTRINNRCVLTGRGRGILRFFRMSRLQIREAHWRGFLYGIRKASW